MIAPANPLAEPPGLKEHFDISWGVFEEEYLQNIFVPASVNTSVDFKSLFTSRHYEAVQGLFPGLRQSFFCIFAFYIKDRFIKRNYPKS